MRTGEEGAGWRRRVVRPVWFFGVLLLNDTVSNWFQPHYARDVRDVRDVRENTNRLCVMYMM